MTFLYFHLQCFYYCTAITFHLSLTDDVKNRFRSNGQEVNKGKAENRIECCNWSDGSQEGGSYNLR